MTYFFDGEADTTGAWRRKPMKDICETKRSMNEVLAVTPIPWRWRRGGQLLFITAPICCKEIQVQNLTEKTAVEECCLVQRISGLEETWMTFGCGVSRRRREGASRIDEIVDVIEFINEMFKFFWQGKTKFVVILLFFETKSKLYFSWKEGSSHFFSVV